MNAATSLHGADVGAELSYFLANRPASDSSALRDGSSTGIFGPSLEVALNTTVNHEAELGAWNAVRASENPQDFLGFLASFPAGIYARRAQKRLSQLGAGDTLQDAKTEPQLRAQISDPGFQSTVGGYATTRPLQPPDRAGPDIAVAVVSDAPAPIPATTMGTPSVSARNVWPLIVGGTVLVGLVALFLNFNSDSLERQADKSVVAAEAQKLVVATLPSEPVVKALKPLAASSPALTTSSTAAAAPVFKVASSPQADASRPVGKTRVPSSTASAPLAASSLVVARPAPVQTTQSEAKSSVTTQGQDPGQGPSMPGQACADRVFIFKITCIAEQCLADRYRHTQECIRFKQMERDREEQQNSRR
jgi:hypothetical protein